MDLKGKRAVITGATRGIGWAVCQALVETGADVALGARHREEVEQAAERLNLQGPGRALGVACDVRSDRQVEGLIGSCVERFGGLEILINNAGIGLFKTVEDMTPQEWSDVLRTNLDGVFYGCHFALPHLKRSGGGFIINISSLAGKNAFPKGAAYNASKFGLNGFSEALMQEVRHDDVQVATIMPGSVDTHFSGTPPEGAGWKMSPLDVAQVVLETLQRHPRCLTSRIEMRPSKPPKK